MLPCGLFGSQLSGNLRKLPLAIDYLEHRIDLGDHRPCLLLIPVF